MASLVLTGGTQQFSWRITGLSSAFSTANGYTEAGITTKSFTSGSTTTPSGIVSTITPPSSSTSTSTTTKTVSYSPGTYTFYAYTKVQDGRYWSAGSATVTVNGQKPVSSGSITIQSISTNSVTISLSAISYATNYHILWKRNYDSYFDEADTTSRTYTITGLLPGIAYTVNYYGYNSYGIGPYMSTGVQFTTEQLITTYGSMSLVSTTKNSITYKLSAIANAVSYYVLCRNASTGAEVDMTTTSLQNTFSWLLSDTTYVLNYYGVDEYGSHGPFMPTGLTVQTKNDIEPWDWASSNGSASAAQTSQAYTAITSNGKFSQFSYLVWNDMVDKAVEIINARGASWNNDYGTASQSKVTSSNSILYAQQFNALWWNLSHFITVTGAQKAVSGAKIYGSYFIALTNAMNNIIP